MGLFFKPHSMNPPPAQLQETLGALLDMSPPPDESTRKTVIAHHMKAIQKSVRALEPRFPVFIGAAALLVILLIITVYVAMAADAQGAAVTSSQLKTLSTALITAFTGLAGAIVGMITGEAVSKKE